MDKTNILNDMKIWLDDKELDLSFLYDNIEKFSNEFWQEGEPNTYIPSILERNVAKTAFKEYLRVDKSKMGAYSNTPQQPYLINKDTDQIYRNLLRGLVDASSNTEPAGRFNLKNDSQKPGRIVIYSKELAKKMPHLFPMAGGRRLDKIPSLDSGLECDRNYGVKKHNKSWKITTSNKKTQTTSVSKCLTNVDARTENVLKTDFRKVELKKANIEIATVFKKKKRKKRSRRRVKLTISKQCEVSSIKPNKMDNFPKLFVPKRPPFKYKRNKFLSFRKKPGEESSDLDSLSLDTQSMPEKKSNSIIVSNNDVCSDYDLGTCPHNSRISFSERMKLRKPIIRTHTNNIGPHWLYNHKYQKYEKRVIQESIPSSPQNITRHNSNTSVSSSVDVLPSIINKNKSKRFSRNVRRPTAQLTEINRILIRTRKMPNRFVHDTTYNAFLNRSSEPQKISQDVKKPSKSFVVDTTSQNINKSISQSSDVDKVTLQTQNTPDSKSEIPDKACNETSNGSDQRKCKKQNRRNLEKSIVKSNEVYSNDQPRVVSTNMSCKYTVYLNDQTQENAKSSRCEERKTLLNKVQSNNANVTTRKRPSQGYITPRFQKPRQKVKNALIGKTQNTCDKHNRTGCNKQSNKRDQSFNDEEAIPIEHRRRRTGARGRSRRKRATTPAPRFLKLRNQQCIPLDGPSQERKKNTIRQMKGRDGSPEFVPEIIKKPQRYERYIAWSLELEGMCKCCIRETKDTIKWTRTYTKKHLVKCDQCYKPATIPKSPPNSCFRCGKKNIMHPDHFANFKRLLGDARTCNDFNSYNLWVQRELAADIYATWLAWPKSNRQIPLLKEYITNQLKYQRLIHFH